MKINSNKLKSLFLLSLVGSASTNEQKPTNQTEINLNSLPQIATNLTERQDNSDPTLIFAGMPIIIDGPSCSVGFAIVWPDGNASGDCTWTHLSGFITSAGCCNGDFCSVKDDNFRDVFLNSKDKVKIGYVQWTFQDYWRETLNSDTYADFVFVSHNFNDNSVKFIPYVVGENNDLVPITSYGPASVGERVCVWLATSGRICGKVVSLDEFEEYRGALSKIIVEVGYDRLDYGSPVYKESNVGERTVAQLVGYINYPDQHENVYIYYARIEKLLEFLSTKENCNMVPLTYNETNSQQYDNLLAQMEIPTKK